MKITNTLITVCCLFFAILGVFCSGSTWRPQGRFGKRLSPVDTAVPDFGFSVSHEIPIEAFFSVKDINRLKTKPRLCSLFGLQGYPACDFSTLSTTEDNDDWATLLGQ